MTMCATVLEVGNCQLLVRDHSTGQEVVVNTDMACRFCVGDRVCIEYNGIMTRSIPPQITAQCITKLSRCGC